MKAGAGRSGTVVSHDLFYDDRAGVASGWRARGALAVEMETATLLRLSELRGVRAAQNTVHVEGGTAEVVEAVGPVGE